MVVELPSESIRQLVEFALDAAAAGRVTIPDQVRALFRARLDAKVARRILSAVEAAPEFREQLAVHATADLLDAPALLWLTRPPDWERQVADSASASPSGDRRLRAVEAKLERSEQRRRGAEADIERLRAQLDALGATLDPLRAELATARRQRDAALVEARRLQQRVDSAAVELAAARAARIAAERQVGEVLRSRRDDLPVALADAASLVEQLGAALARAADAAAPALERSPSTVVAPPRRQRQRLPGGVRDGTEEAARHLLRAPGVAVFVDGYNVAKLGWPSEHLAGQRALCLAAAGDVARRARVDVTVVFDGSEVVGAAGPGRPGVRVEFSPDGVEADDLLRRHAAEQLPGTAVVVVTDDREVIDDVRALGADVIPSAVFLRLAHSG